MTSAMLQQWRDEGGAANLGARAKFQLTGGDRVRYLNGQVTNDVRRAGSDATLYACVTDLKGRIASDVFIHAAADGQSLWVDAEADCRDALAARLERYIIADDVELTDATDDWQFWHVFGAAATAYVAGQNGALQSRRLGIDGVDLWLPAGSPAPQTGGALLSDEDWETFRILQGIPRQPNELNTDAFPPEAGLDERAMSYTKGCYIGQEVLSRIRTTGRMPRVLVQWRAEGGSAVATGESLFADDGKTLGTITSVALDPATGGQAGLAYVKQGSAVAHSKLPVGAERPRIGASVEIFAIVH